MSTFVTDTHPLVWYGNGKLGNLSKSALRAFADAEVGNAFVHIPAIVLLETAILERQGKIKLTGGFLRWTETLLKNPGSALFLSNHRSSMPQSAMTSTMTLLIK